MHAKMSARAPKFTISGFSDLCINYNAKLINDLLLLACEGRNVILSYSVRLGVHQIFPNFDDILYNILHSLTKLIMVFNNSIIFSHKLFLKCFSAAIV